MCPKIPSHVFFSAIAASYPLLKQRVGGKEERHREGKGERERKKIIGEGKLVQKHMGENVDRERS